MARIGCTILLGGITVLSLAGCKKHHDTLPKTPPPVWTIDTSGKYSASMTAVVQVSENLRPYIQQSDQIAAFIDGECRGTGTLIESAGVSAFFILIHGTASEQKKISFQYYASWKSHLYSTPAFLAFTVDGTYGSVDVPGVLSLDPVR